MSNNPYLPKLGRKWKILLPLALILVILGVYAYFFSFLNSSYSPYYGDEFFYFKNSEKFFENSSLRSVFTYSGNGSKILGADAHGPAYPLIYGTFAKIVGWGALTIPILNLGVLVLAVLMLIWNESSKEIKALKFLLVFGSPITLFYSVTYLPELIHLAGAIGLLLLLKLYLSRDTFQNYMWLIGFILMLGMIRSTWFLALFCLVSLPGPIKGWWKLIYPISGLALSYFFQYFLHEQVPNVFSELASADNHGGFISAVNIIVENFLQNILYTFTYADGDFYVMQKIWIYFSIITSIILYRKDKLTESGLIILGSIILFNITLYKNYTWIDLRTYVPMTIFLNLRIFTISSYKHLPPILLTLNLISFILILPLQEVLINYRIGNGYKKIEPKIITDLSNLNTTLVLIDSIVLSSYKIVELPIKTFNKEDITYILPYYKMSSKTPTHQLVEEKGHLCVKLVSILNQNANPSKACKE